MTTLHFYESVFATCYKVLGKRLPPLSLWHLAALEAVESPFVTGRGNVSLGDIQMAVQICQSRWPNRPEPRPTLWTRVQNIWRNRNERYVREQAEIMAAHIAHHQIFPDVWSDEGGGKPLGAPAVLTRVVGLIAINVSLDQAWNHISPGMASWMISADAERKGNLEIVSDRDKAIMADLEAKGGEGGR
jgi:hypothetical protein